MNLYTLAEEELVDINAGDVKDVVTTGVGVAGGILGAAGGFMAGYTKAGAGFTGGIAVAAGVAGGVVGAAGGYVAGKTAAEEAWDIVASLI